MFHFPRLPNASALLLALILPAVGCAVPMGEADLDGSGGTTNVTDPAPDPGTGGATTGTGGLPATGGMATGTGGEVMGTGGEATATGGTGTGGTYAGPDPDLCEWIFGANTGFLYDSVCHPQCTPSVGTDGMGWGWENNASCIHPGSQVAGESTTCEFDVTTEGECPADGAFNCPGDANCGCELVAGLGSNKSMLWAAGASEEPYMIAAAMMETQSMSANDPSYPYGDGKWDDAFNAGVAKQNWGMIRQCHTPWNGLEPWDYDTAAAMNTDLALDVQVFRQCRDYYGELWWTYHRQGLGYTPGSDSWREQDIANFKAAMDWTYCLLDGHYSDNVRFWVDVSAI